MSRILARLKKVNSEDINHILKKEIALTVQEEEALRKKYPWNERDHLNEALFLFCNQWKKKNKNL
jgi:hypothetical protein